MIRPGGVLICKGNKSSGSLGEALPRASFAPPLVITLSLPGLKSVSLDIASAHMAALKAFFFFPCTAAGEDVVGNVCLKIS